MGTWGAGIFDDDSASDASEEWRELIRAGEADAKATAAILEKYGSTPAVVLGLAATQWKWGRLQRSVATRALRMLRDGDAFVGWEGDARRARILRALAEKLRTPPPAPKKLKAVASPGEWKAGEVIAWRAMDGKFALMRVVEQEKSYGRGAAPTCEMLDWYGVEIPPRKTIATLGLRRATLPDDRIGAPEREHPFFTLGTFRAGEYPDRRVRRLRIDTELPRKAPKQTVGLHWDNFDAFLASRFGIGWTTGSVLTMESPGVGVFVFLVRSVRRTPFSNYETSVDVLDWRERRYPGLMEVNEIRARQSNKYPEWAMGVIVLGVPEPANRVSLLGMRGPTEDGPRRDIALGWRQLEEWLIEDSPEL